MTTILPILPLPTHAEMEGPAPAGYALHTGHGPFHWCPVSSRIIYIMTVKDDKEYVAGVEIPADVDRAFIFSQSNWFDSNGCHDPEKLIEPMPIFDACQMGRGVWPSMKDAAPEKDAYLFPGEHFKEIGPDGDFGRGVKI